MLIHSQLYWSPIYWEKCPIRRGIGGVEAAAGEGGESGGVVAAGRRVVELEEGVGWWSEEKKTVESEEEGGGKLQRERHECGYHDEVIR